MRFLITSLLLAAIFAPLGCDQGSTNVNRKDGVKDALDTRPAEGARDAAEDATDSVKRGAKDTKDAVNDATR